MIHNLVFRYDEYVLRPVTLADAAFIVTLRNAAHVKGRVNDSATTVREQEEWLKRYFERDGEYYWIFERLSDHQPFGAGGLYDLDRAKNQIECGRWVMMPNNRINVMTAPYQVFQFAFDDLCVDRIVCDVVADNKSVLRFHQLLGAREFGVEKAKFVIGGMPVDVVWFEYARTAWPKTKARFEYFRRFDRH